MGGRVDARTGTLKPPIDLGRSDRLAMGDLRADPAARRLDGPAGSILIEPRVMQLLVALADGGGHVVSREELTGRCWPGLLVGEDSLNRAIGGLRRALKDAGTTGVALETVPKVGYRLVAHGPPAPEATPPDAEPADIMPSGPSPRTEREAGLSRRRLVGGVAAAAALAGTGWLLWDRHRAAETDVLVRTARDRLARSEFGAGNSARALMEEALARDPGRADAWGVLALSWQEIARGASAGTLAEAEANTQSAARRALALDRAQGDALAALALLPPLFGDWHAAEERLTRTLDVAPENVAAQAGMGLLAASVGRMADSLQLADRLLAETPAHRDAAARRIHALWAIEGTGAALKAATDWQAGGPGTDAPDLLHPWLLAFAGDTDAAGRLVGQTQARQRHPSRILTAMQLSCQAMASGQRKDADQAEAALTGLARFGGGTNAIGILGLCGLGRHEQALDMAQNWYRTAAAAGPTAAERTARLHRTRTSVLFLPPAQGLRAHPRFLPLCEEAGLAGYWRGTARRPDFMAGAYLPI